jgi:hypothetical protein
LISVVFRWFENSTEKGAGVDQATVLNVKRKQTRRERIFAEHLRFGFSKIALPGCASGDSDVVIRIQFY